MINLKLPYFRCLLIVAALIFPGISAAVSYNFLDIADGNDVTGTADPNGEYGANPINFLKGGIGLQASGRDRVTNANYNAYLDSGGAGLGVCKNLTGSNQCTPSSDDNVTFDEELRFQFTKSIRLTQLYFLNGNHTNSWALENEGEAGTPQAWFGVLIAGIWDNIRHRFDPDEDNSNNLGNDPTLVDLTAFNYTGTDISLFHQSDFDINNYNGDLDRRRFYVSELNVDPVPLPAAVWLMGSGLLGLMGLSRRKPNSTVAA